MNFKSLFLIALSGFVALSEATWDKKPRNFIMVSYLAIAHFLESE